ncbi:MAG TPA: YdeI/OmpD-associated family protein [Rubellimicrobium sp.]|nr:YdeI/OmpD-associated family protein [Rubellimicrobium sp.]
MAKRPLDEAPEVEVRSRAELRAWLSANHARPSGVWLVTHKKAQGAAHVPYEEIVLECLAHGWIDSLGRAKDEARTMLYIAPRKLGSNWSRPNKERVERLEALGLMTPMGRAAIDRAKGDGSWTALDGVEALEVPPDLASALDAAQARAAWDAFPRSVRRGVLELLLNAKRPETRVAKISAVAEAAAKGERPFQWGKV